LCHAVNRKVSVVVIDGITIGHPCCAHHNCQIPLASNRHRYCPAHSSLNGQCVIVGCNADAVDGCMTCADSVHREVERVKKVRGEGRFQLKDRLQRQRVAHPNDSVAQDIDVTELEDVDDAQEEFSVDSEGRVILDSGDNFTGPNGDDVHAEPNDDNNDQMPPVEPYDPVETGIELMEDGGLVNGARPKKIRAQFGRKHTHNEQIMVAPCGMILARSTFFGAEAVSTVVVCNPCHVLRAHLKVTFRNSLNGPSVSTA
jgi:hypothetical protein